MKEAANAFFVVPGKWGSDHQAFAFYLSEPLRMHMFRNDATPADLGLGERIDADPDHNTLYHRCIERGLTFWGLD